MGHNLHQYGSHQCLGSWSSKWNAAHFCDRQTVAHNCKQLTGALVGPKEAVFGGGQPALCDTLTSTRVHG